MSYGRNRKSLLSGPRSCPVFGVQTDARLPPHPDVPGPLVPWDQTETESEAPIMSYGPFFAAPEAVRYSPPGAPAADRTQPNPTQIVPRLPILPGGPPRGMNRPPGGANRKTGKNGPDLTHFSAFKLPGG